MLRPPASVLAPTPPWAAEERDAELPLLAQSTLRPRLSGSDAGTPWRDHAGHLLKNRRELNDRRAR